MWMSDPSARSQSIQRIEPTAKVFPDSATESEKEISELNNEPLHWTFEVVDDVWCRKIY
jgi:hypothetical protein